MSFYSSSYGDNLGIIPIIVLKKCICCGYPLESTLRDSCNFGMVLKTKVNVKKIILCDIRGIASGLIMLKPIKMEKLEISDLVTLLFR